MAVGDAIPAAMGRFMKRSGMTHAQMAKGINVHRTSVTKMLSGERAWPEAQDAALSRQDFTLALTVGSERSGGYFVNLLDILPEFDQNPAAVLMLLRKNLQEGIAALEASMMSFSMNPKNQEEQDRKIYKELLDVEALSAVYRGIMERTRGLDGDRIRKEHELEIKRGER